MAGELVGQRVGTTLALAFSALFVTIAIAQFPWAALAALEPRKAWNRPLCAGGCSVSAAVPIFWLGLHPDLLFAVIFDADLSTSGLTTLAGQISFSSPPLRAGGLGRCHSAGDGA